MFGPLLLSIVLGCLIGIERQVHKHSAGMRTFTLICLGSTLATLVSTHIGNGDPGRISAQIVTGVSFLGAGIIIHSRDKVYGLTTAACVWVVAIIGIAIGAGLYFEATSTTLLTMILLTIFNKFK